MYNVARDTAEVAYDILIYWIIIILKFSYNIWFTYTIILLYLQSDSYNILHTSSRDTLDTS